MAPPKKPCALPPSSLFPGPYVPKSLDPQTPNPIPYPLMARLYPFRAWRYNPSAVRLEDVVTQPYDKISPAIQQAYYQRSPFNLVRILLGLPELFDAERGESVYTRAAREFHVWRQLGVLTQEKSPSLYAYSQRFRLPGSGIVKERRSFIALGKLYDFSDQVVFPHQLRLPEPITDRLDLLKATRAHFDQILMLYADPAGSVEKILYDGSGPADIQVTDDAGVLHSLWRIGDPATIGLLTTAMADKKLILADGHHRYQTALAYAKEHAPAPSHPPEKSDSTRSLSLQSGSMQGRSMQDRSMQWPEAAAMMTFVNMDSDGLVIQPTHRVLQGLSNPSPFDPVAFALAAQQFFTLEALPDADAPSYIDLLGRHQGTAFVAITRAGALLLRARPEAQAALAHLPERQRPLDLTQLHALLLDQVLAINAENLTEKPSAPTHIRYLRDPVEAIDQVHRGQADIAFLTNPVPIEQLKEVAFAGEQMPPNSTDFYPKPLSGLTIYALD